MGNCNCNIRQKGIMNGKKIWAADILPPWTRAAGGTLLEKYLVARALVPASRLLECSLCTSLLSASPLTALLVLQLQLHQNLSALH